MKALAAYIMRGRVQAVSVTALSAALSFLLAPLSLVSGAAVGLVTLRVGARQGLVVIAIAASAVTALFVFAGHGIMPGVAFSLAAWLPVWLLGAVLRRSLSLPLTIAVAGAMGAMVVLAIHGMVEDPSLWWRGQMEALLAELARAQGQMEAPTGAFLDQVAGLMTGAAGAGAVLGTMSSLLLARWWQSLLYNPGGFREEFHGLQLGSYAGAITVALIALAGLGGGRIADVAGDLAVVAMMLHLLQGLALIHGVAARRKAHVTWLFAVYALLVVAMPQTAMVLAVAGMADTIFDFRAFFKEKDA